MLNNMHFTKIHIFLFLEYKNTTGNYFRVNLLGIFDIIKYFNSLFS